MPESKHPQHVGRVHAGRREAEQSLYPRSHSPTSGAVAKPLVVFVWSEGMASSPVPRAPKPKWALDESGCPRVGCPGQIWLVTLPLPSETDTSEYHDERLANYLSFLQGMISSHELGIDFLERSDEWPEGAIEIQGTVTQVRHIINDLTEYYPLTTRGIERAPFMRTRTPSRSGASLS